MSTESGQYSQECIWKQYKIYLMITVKAGEPKGQWHEILLSALALLNRLWKAIDEAGTESCQTEETFQQFV